MAPPWLLLGALTLVPLSFCTQVPAPEDLRVQALNTDYTLLWSWGQGSEGQTVSFTVQYMGAFRKNRPKWRQACEETWERSCDLNPLDLHYLGIYSLRVQASVDGLTSNWTALDFAPAKDAAVGPPTSVKVSAAGNVLEVSVTEPRTINNTSMKDKIPSLSFRFMFWEKERSGQRTPVDSPNTMVTLDKLSFWTFYCVSVQSLTIDPDRTSAFTEPLCLSTEGPHWLKICLCFLASLCGAFLLVFGVSFGAFHCHRRLKNSFHPRVTRPVFLDQLHVSPELLLLDWSEHQCDLLTVTSELQPDLTVTSELQPDLTVTSELQPDLTVTSELQPDLTVTSELQPDLTVTSELQPDLTVTSELQPDLTVTSELQPDLTVTSELQPDLTMTSELQPDLTVTSELEDRVSLLSCCEDSGIDSSNSSGQSSAAGSDFTQGLT
ncbi:interferon alpha/beta receptor 1b-like [Eucyclogobius newberryi]|uniref:interferon alpha/beta receptor 1b-like n=1 Tax=Eucyclogobius newberryi TaxID=166745 RepID=UPI003B5BE910